MREALSFWLLILFVILAMGVAGNMELQDRLTLLQDALVMADN